MDDKELDKIKKELMGDFNKVKDIQSRAIDSYYYYNSQENQDSLILSISGKAAVVSALMAIEGEERSRRQNQGIQLNKQRRIG